MVEAACERPRIMPRRHTGAGPRDPQVLRAEPGETLRRAEKEHLAGRKRRTKVTTGDFKVVSGVTDAFVQICS